MIRMNFKSWAQKVINILLPVKEHDGHAHVSVSDSEKTVSISISLKKCLTNLNNLL